ncbi:MAG: PEP-CTERM sorting domain-containing protein [Acidobacteriia bacterium]|nr:PEP-CTERM sorting domain-containing protein [Terriglobia bacterium]
MRSKYIILAVALITALFLTQSGVAATETIDFSSNSGATITFTYAGSGSNAGANFTFLPNGTPASDFHITGISGFTGSNVLNGLNGDIEGIFHFNNGDIDYGFFTEQAPVTGNGTFIIHDGNNHDFTAALVFNTILEDFSSEQLTYTGGVNLTNFQYSGSNAQLLQLANSTNGSLEADFSFGYILGVDLNDLSSYSKNGYSTCFDGQVTATPSAVPEPGTYGLLMVGMLGLLGTVRRLRQS